ncbi:hypothetical protein [Nonomuraea angiospora]|uniref:hypothetical protein n=1 Tax=Nonomuraea angiospora TaxID=46172 RepID=UPI0029BDC436|nr:hypothetical protein [Nonomuraea angiospora]MDX3107492.1 hypothetical protein [Nonomuraea angiospora]
MAAAALADNLPRLADGSYRVHINDGYDDTELGRVYRSGRRWQALNNRAVSVFRALIRASREQAVAPRSEPGGCRTASPAPFKLSSLCVPTPRTELQRAGAPLRTPGL